MFKRRGAISTVIATIVSVTIIFSVFLLLIFQGLELQKYALLNQYARDTLLICETKNPIPASYLNSIYYKLQGKLHLKNGEQLNMYVIVNGREYNIARLSQDIVTDFGEPIEIRLEYYYYPYTFSLQGFLLQKDTQLSTMRVQLETISKNRGTSDG